SKDRKGKAAFELDGRPETIQETAEMVDARGGKGIAVQVDHTVEDQVKALFERVKKEQGRLDLLVNNVCGDELNEWKQFWKSSLQKGMLMIERSVHSHIITNRYAVPLMVEQRKGLIVEITDSEGFYYRGNIYFDLSKIIPIRLAFALARDLR